MTRTIVNLDDTFGDVILSGPAKKPTALETMNLIREQDRKTKSIVLPTEHCIPISSRRFELSGRQIRVSPAASRSFRRPIHLSMQMLDNLKETLRRDVYQDLIRNDRNSALPRMPKQLRVLIHRDEIIGFGDGSRPAIRNGAVIDAVREAISGLHSLCGSRLRYAKVSVTRFKLRMTFPGVARSIDGHTLEAGLAVSNSALGHSTPGTAVRTYIHREECQNGMTIPVCSDSTDLLRPLGHSETELLDGIVSATRQAVHEFALKLEAVSGLTREWCRPRDEVDRIAAHQRLSPELTGALLEAIDLDEAGPVPDVANRLDVIQALARVGTHGAGARRIPEGDRERLMIVAGTMAQHRVHSCPNCLRILEPSRN